MSISIIHSIWLKGLEPPRQVPAKGDHPDLIALQAEALVLRKLFLMGYVLLLPEDHAMGRLLLAMMVTIVFLVVQLVAKPFRRQTDDILAALGQVVVLCCLVAAASIKVADEFEMGEESIGLSPFQSSVVVLLFTFGILALVFLAGKAYARRLAPRIDALEQRWTTLSASFDGLEAAAT